MLANVEQPRIYSFVSWNGSLLDFFKEQGIRSLQDVHNANLKALLRRVIGKIFSKTEIKGWCKRFLPHKPGHADNQPVYSGTSSLMAA